MQVRPYAPNSGLTSNSEAAEFNDIVRTSFLNQWNIINGSHGIMLVNLFKQKRLSLLKVFTNISI
jgi:hypothetical protein